MTLVRTSSMDECEEALSVSLNAFYPDGVSVELEKLWRTKWFDDPGFTDDAVFVVKDGTRMVAGLKTVTRTLMRGDERFRMLGIGETFTHPDYRGRGLARELTGRVIAHAQDTGFHVVAVVARRAIDGFYLRYGLWGVGSYPEVLFSGIDEADVSALSVEQASPEFEVCQRAYSHAYGRGFGPVVRSEEHWQYVKKMVPLAGRRFFMIRRGRESLGYAITDGRDVLEVALLPGVEYGGLLPVLARCCEDRDKGGILCRVAESHPILEKDLQFDVSTRKREVYYGGHVLRILNIEEVLAMYRVRLEAYLRDLGAGPRELHDGSIRIGWDGSRVEVTLDSSDPVPYGNTLALMGIEPRYHVHAGHKLGAPRFPFFMPPVDEF